MPVIALQGIRGGVGTTSVAAGLAFALQQLGESVLAVDLSSDNLLRLHFNMAFEQPRGWARAYANGKPWQESAMRYMPLLDFLPFGSIPLSQKPLLAAKCEQHPDFLKDLISQLISTKKYQWILLDLPAENTLLSQQGLEVADEIFTLLNTDANCHLRLHQQFFSEKNHFLVNKYTLNSSLQEDIYQVWQATLQSLLPIMLHRDEAVGEALAVKQPLGEYCPHSLAAEEILTLASWCLINVSRKKR